MCAKALRSILPFDWILIELGVRELIARIVYANTRRACIPNVSGSPMWNIYLLTGTSDVRSGTLNFELILKW